MFQYCNYVLSVSNASLFHTQYIWNLVNGVWILFLLERSHRMEHQGATSLAVQCWTFCAMSSYSSGFHQWPCRVQMPCQPQEWGSREVGLESKTKGWRNWIWGFFCVCFFKVLTNDTVTVVKNVLLQYWKNICSISINEEHTRQLEV